jgi:hypothetical protein
MKLAILRLVVVVLACTCAMIVVSNLRAPHASANQNKFAPLYSALGMPQPEQTPAAGAPEKTIAQEGREKNVKLLGDMPVSQFIPVMNYFAVSMGRRCNYCHVNNNGQWDYAADTKPEKNTAREMIKMVLGVNKETFKGQVQVGCYTCHRGRNNPQSLPVLPLPTPQVPPAGAGGPGGAAGPGGGAQPQGSPTPRPTPIPGEELIQKYVNAIGGQAAIDKIKSRMVTGTVNTASGLNGTYEMGQVAPDKGYEVFVAPRATIRRALTANGAWEQSPQGVREVSGLELSRARASMLLFGNIKLKEQYTRLRTAGREKVGERDAYVVLATRAENDTERLYFDVETGFLVRKVTYLRTMVGVIPEQTDFEDYRDVDGVKMPFTIRVSPIDAGNAYIVRKITEIKLNVPVDDSKFNKPAATASPTP